MAPSTRDDPIDLSSDDNIVLAYTGTNLRVEHPQIKTERIEDAETFPNPGKHTAATGDDIEPLEVDDTSRVQNSIEMMEVETQNPENLVQIKRSDSPLNTQQNDQFMHDQVQLLAEYHGNVHGVHTSESSHGTGYVEADGSDNSNRSMVEGTGCREAVIDQDDDYNELQAEANRKRRMLDWQDRGKGDLAAQVESGALFVAERDSDEELQHTKRTAPRPKTNRRKVRGSGKGISKDIPPKKRQLHAHRDKFRPTMLNKESLGQSNFIHQAQQNVGLPSQPGFDSTNKKGALAQMGAQDPRFGATIKALNDSCKAFKSRGVGSMQADGRSGWRLKGMETGLYHFQLLGAAWAVARERSDEAPSGGIVADEMGLGKTIQMLSVMVENRPKPEDRYRTTLVVCPPSICDQWVQEIGKHVSRGIFKGVMKYSAVARTDDPTMIVDNLSELSVVVATYHDVMSSYPNDEPPSDLATEEEKDEWWQAYYADNCGPLMKVKFHRIVLDEAHKIKNHDSRTSKACRALMGKCKWALTGTLLSNRVEELFPYLNFLGVEGAGDPEDFKSQHCKGDELSTEGLSHLLEKIMIRRTHGDTLFGRPLVTLPNIDYETIILDFDPLEKKIYGIVHKRFVKKLNAWSTSGQIENNSHHVFAMLVRLRQMCSHILMVGRPIRELLEIEDIEELGGLITQDALGSAHKQRVQVVQQFLRKAQDEKNSRDHVGSNDRAAANMDSVHLTVNRSSFKSETFLQSLKGRVADGETSQQNAFFDLDTMPEEYEEDKNDMSWLKIPGAHLMSTKAQAVKSLLEEWLITGTSDTKVVVFSLWIPMIKVLGQICVEQGWGSEEYTGKMNNEARQRALQRWKASDGKKQVLLSSMGAGGLGLNLIEANYVILVDPWWNVALEDQACARVYRIGQQRPCVVRKLVIEGAYDTEVMLEMQQRKTAEINKVMDGRRKTKNTVLDVMKFFGRVTLDAATKQPIIVDDEGKGDVGSVIGNDHNVQNDGDTEHAVCVPGREVQEVSNDASGVSGH